MDKLLQAKHVTDSAFLGVIDRIRADKRRWTHVWDVVEALSMPEKIVRAKAKSLIKRGVITGCACGCRGDFERKELTS
jgi:hypothetical protein